VYAASQRPSVQGRGGPPKQIALAALAFELVLIVPSLGRLLDGHGIVRGNLLEADVEALVNAVNTEGVMGKGSAMRFARASSEATAGSVQTTIIGRRRTAA
jgi:hypothetical protein